MNQYIRENTLFPISEHDVKLFSQLVSHPGDSRLAHHAIKDSRITRTDFVKNMIRLSKLLNLKVSSVTAFTGKSGTHCLPHIDGDEDTSYSWRISYYVQGEPAILNWYTNTDIVDKHYILDTSNKRVSDVHTPTGYTIINTDEIVHSELLNMQSAFVRTNIPHSLDMTATTTPRITVSATFYPYISWEKLNNRLDNLYIK